MCIVEDIRVGISIACANSELKAVVCLYRYPPTILDEIVRLIRVYCVGEFHPLRYFSHHDRACLEFTDYRSSKNYTVTINYMRRLTPDLRVTAKSSSGGA